jgi:hypothetical protein
MRWLRRTKIPGDATRGFRMASCLFGGPFCTVGRKRMGRVLSTVERDGSGAVTVRRDGRGAVGGEARR